MLGLDWISRWVMVDWLRFWIVREVSGAWSLAKKAPVRASARAPSTAKTRLLAFAGDRRGDAVLDPDAEDPAAPVDDGDDRVVGGVGGGRPLRAGC